MENTAKNFALQLGSLITLYVSVVALVVLLFGVITIQFPDIVQYSYEYSSATSSVRFCIALLIVFFPTYVVLTRFVNTIRRNEHGLYLALTKWLIYLSLVIGGAAILGDFVAVVNNFLSGELTIRFALKALSFFTVVGLAFLYYLLDAKAYWQAHEKHSIYYGTIVSILVFVSIVLGIVNIESPKEVREMNIDATQVQDLGIIQTNIETYYSTHGQLPENLETAFGTMSVTTAPEGRTPYTYTVLSNASFKLCADFYRETSKSDQMQYTSQYSYGDMYIHGGYNWMHSKGTTCFTRTFKEESDQKIRTQI